MCFQKECSPGNCLRLLRKEGANREEEIEGVEWAVVEEPEELMLVLPLLTFGGRVLQEER